jgi:hypothetical protein
MRMLETDNRRLPWLMLGCGACVAIVLVTFVVVFAISGSATVAAPTYRVITVGGLQYEAVDGRPLDPANAVDAKILAGVPAGERQTPRGEVLFAAFVAVANQSQGALDPAGTIELVASPGEVYHPIPIAAQSPYAFPTRPIHPRTRIPASNRPAGENLAAGGRVLVFKVPARVYNNEALELVIHDPDAPTVTGSLGI